MCPGNLLEICWAGFVDTLVNIATDMSMQRMFGKLLCTPDICFWSLILYIFADGFCLVMLKLIK